MMIQVMASLPAAQDLTANKERQGMGMFEGVLAL